MEKVDARLIADKDTIIRAIQVLSDAFQENGIPKLEGGIACRAMLTQLAKEGVDIRSEPTLQS